MDVYCLSRRKEVLVRPLGLARRLFDTGVDRKKGSVSTSNSRDSDSIEL